MRLNRLIEDLQDIQGEHGDCEIAIWNSNDWRRHKAVVRPRDLGHCFVVRDQYGYVPAEVIESNRGYLEPYRSELARLPQFEVLLISL